MASIQTLRQHNQNPVRPEDTRNTKALVHGVAAVGSKTPIRGNVNAAHTSKGGAENQDPSIRNVKGTAVDRHVGSSRLPVLARSQPLPSRTDSTKVLGKLEQSYQKGKAQKKPCTKPVPFSLSQPKATRAATVSHRKTQLTEAAAATTPFSPNSSQPPRPVKNFCSTGPPVKLPAASLNALPLTAPHTALSHTHVAPGVVVSACSGSDSVQSDSQETEIHACVQSRPPLALQGTSCTPARVEPPGAANGVQFSPDPAALDSILQNEGVKSRGLMGATPQTSVCPSGKGASVYRPQRVSVLRTRPRPQEPSPGGAVQFSPDPAALGSILRNEGVNAEGPLVATPGGSLCRPGRGTSVYMPQRVPLTKAHSEAAGVCAGAASSQSPAVKWTPVRIPNTRPQSTMRHFSSHRTPLFRGSPALRSLQGFRRDLGPHKEEPVVQKLFEEAEQEVESKADLDEESVTGRQKDQPAPQQPHDVLPDFVNKGRVGEGSGGWLKEESGRAQPFVPPPHRESVIVFSSAKKIVAATGGQRSCHGPESLPPPCPLPVASAPTATAVPPLTAAPHPSLSTARGGLVQWVPRLCSSAHATRQRPRPLEECLLDEECAMFTLRPSTAAAHPRSANPVASALLLQNSTGFVPVDLAPLSTTADYQPVYCPVPMSLRHDI